MQLQTGNGPHMVDVTFYRRLQRQRFLMTQHQNHHFFCIQQGAYAHGQRVFRHQIHITIEEAGVRHTGVMSQGLNTGTGRQRRGRFVERDVAIVAHAAHEQVDFTVGTNFFFIATAFRIDIRRVTIQQVDIFCRNINVVKEITVHEAMIAFRMLFWQADIFVHIKGDDVFEANLACFMHFNQRFVGGQRSATGWQTQHERAVRSRFECINTVNDVAGSPFTDLLSGYQGDQSHSSPL
ncbi:conserved hypothetical protein [Klebsiella variicola]|nr:conserved hypothetical protein [Klebsiella variicola]